MEDVDLCIFHGKDEQFQKQVSEEILKRILSSERNHRQLSSSESQEARMQGLSVVGRLLHVPRYGCSKCWLATHNGCSSHIA